MGKARAKVILFLTLCLIVISGQNVSASLVHRWKVSGSVDITGFNTENEPLNSGEASDDTGTLINLKFDIHYDYRDYLSARLSLVTEGASRYSLLLGGDHNSYYGTVGSASGSDLIPIVDEASLELRTATDSYWFTVGLIRTHRFSKYALPGALAGYRFGNGSIEAWVVDAGHRQPWSRQEVQLVDGLEVSDAVDAVFYGTRLSGQTEKISGWLEVTLLNDKTPDDHRWNTMKSFWGPIREDTLGTATASFSGRWRQWSTMATVSQNFGHAQSDDDRGQFDYSGRRLDAKLGYQWGTITVYTRYLYQSGARFPHPDSEEEYKEFKGFSYYVPTNGALYDSHYFKESGPPVLLGSRKTPFYGVGRPNLHSDMSSPENLRSLSLHLSWEPASTLHLTTSLWKVDADQVYWVSTGEDYFKPSKDLGWELDASFFWYPVKHLAVSGFWGMLFLGDFYGEIEQYFPLGLSKPVENSWVGKSSVSQAELGVTLWF